MVLPHVAASRIVRQVSGLAHLSPGEWLQCLLARNVVQIFIQSTQKNDAVSFDPGGAGAPKQEGGTSV